MNRDRQPSSGSAGTPIKLRTNRQTEERTPSSQRPRLPKLEDEDDPLDGYVIPRSRTSAIRYDRRASLLADPKKTKLIKQRHVGKWTLLTWLCLAIMVMVGGWFLLSKVADWWTDVHDNLVYGTPRTFQADQYVGLGDSPAHPDHFIALNLRSVIEVVQINPLDRKKDGVFVLANVGNDSTPVGLSFRDTTGSGRIDVIVTIGDSTPYSVILINNGTTFVPTQPAH